MIEVKVTFFPGKVYNLNLEEPTTVGDVLDMVDNPVENNMTISINGDTVNRSTHIYSSTSIVITKKVKGNAINVTVTKFPGPNQRLSLDDGSTVQDAINAADFETDGFDIKVDGTTADMNAIISDGTRIILTKKIKGN